MRSGPHYNDCYQLVTFGKNYYEHFRNMVDVASDAKARLVTELFMALKSVRWRQSGRSRKLRKIVTMVMLNDLGQSSFIAFPEIDKFPTAISQIFPNVPSARNLDSYIE
jgi:hypothetical protein